MPRLSDAESHKLPNDNFGYSAVRMKELGSTEYTLVTIVCDQSGSVASFKDDLEKCLKEIAAACKYSKRADNLMIRLVLFHTQLTEVHGFKLLSSINPDDYIGCVQPGSATALYDASCNAIRATTDYGRELAKQDFTCNAVVIICTDGDDNSSIEGTKSVQKALAEATKTEALESCVSILVAVNAQDPGMQARLDTFQKEAGFTQYVCIDQATSKALAKLAAFVSKSISSQSQALGTGGASKSLTF